MTGFLARFWMFSLLSAMSLPVVYGAGEPEPKMVSGISIVGNNEAPKSLFIVSWKGSEIGEESDLTSGLLDDSMRPVDRDVFMREINFYDIRQGN